RDGNPVYENFYRQVDPDNTGRVGPTEAALFLKKSGLPDSTLGKVGCLHMGTGVGCLIETNTALCGEALRSSKVELRPTAHRHLAVHVRQANNS
uniref:EH domain-containing protein n=1 Tax=Fundulus heteroclitus TaxID=8078 RepID=A0A3Q2NSA4_FUNHE